MLALMLPLLCAGCSLQSPARGPDRNPIQLEDLEKLAFVFDPELSPDGSSVAYTLGRANFATDRRESAIQLYDVRDKTTRVLIHDRLGANSPRWSPDGKMMAFCALDKEFDMQIF